MDARLATAFGLVLACAGCAEAPPAPLTAEIVLPERFAFSAAADPGPYIGTDLNAAWWRDLSDPILTNVMERALSGAIDLEIAQARIDSARAAVATTGPGAQLSGPLNGEVQRVLPRDQDRQTVSRIALSPAFLFDLFGRERNRRQLAQYEFDAALFDAGAARLSVQAAVIEAYLEICYLNAAIRATQQSAANRTEFLETVRLRSQTADATEIDISRAEFELLAVRADLAELREQRVEAAIELGTLAAMETREIERLLARGGAHQPVPDFAAEPGVPAALLRDRPDALAAEARLRAAAAALAISEADLYPSLRLSGTLQAGTNGVFQFGPRIDIPLLDLPVRKAQRDVARAELREAELAWRGTIATAIDEVEIALNRYAKTAERRRTAALQMRAATKLLGFLEETFQVGEATLPEVLVADDDLQSARMRLAQAERDAAVAWARLQIAAGRGWSGGRDSGRPKVDATASNSAKAISETTAPGTVIDGS